MARPDLTFFWPNKPEGRFSLTGPVLLSFICHGLAFTLLQVSPKEKATAPKREQEVELLSEDVPAHRALLDAVEAESPVGALSHQLFPAEDLLASAGRPHIFQNSAAPLEPNQWAQVKHSIVLQLSSKASAAPVQPNPSQKAARLEWNDGIAARVKVTSPLPMVPQGRLLENPSFLVGFGAEGRVSYVLRQRSSGDEAADALVEKTLRELEFQPEKREVEWAFATFFWGLAAEQ